MPSQKQISTQELCDKVTQSFVTRALYYSGFSLFNFIKRLFLHLIATVLEFLYLIATLSSLLIARSCNLTVIRYCLMSVVIL